MAGFNRTIRHADAGITNNAFLSRKGSFSAIEPMMRELTASSTHPQVITKPIAVPVMRGKASPTMANVVGKTGAIEMPAKKTSKPASDAFFVRKARSVVIAMAAEAASVTVALDAWIRMGATATRPTSSPTCKTKREDVQGTRLCNALSNQVANQPIPNPHVAGDIEE
jgi:hypothetical protein